MLLNNLKLVFLIFLINIFIIDFNIEISFLKKINNKNLYI